MTIISHVTLSITIWGDHVLEQNYVPCGQESKQEKEKKVSLKIRSTDPKGMKTSQ